MTERRSGTAGFLKGHMFSSLVAYVYAAMRPVMDKVHIRRRHTRRLNPADVMVPEGFTVEVVASGLNAPVHCCFDDAGNCYVSETGWKIQSPPRIVKVDIATGATAVFYEEPEERWTKTGALTGACWHDGWLYFTNTDRLSRVSPEGSVEDLVTGLPGLGDHQTNYPVVGPDDKIYFRVGTATNSGIVGQSEYAFEWVRNFPEFHDVPGQDVTLTGRNVEMADVLGGRLTEKVHTGAYVPFGTSTEAGQVITGDVKCTGSVLRCNADGSDLQLVAWGLRNPYGMAVHPDGRLFVTEHGIDERGERFVVGDLDDLYEVEEGAWYGFPDYASGIRLDDPRWGTGGLARAPLIADPPQDPPMPFATFTPHAAANGLDFCRDETFGFHGDAFVALFGDASPITTRTSTPEGFKVARVDMANRTVVDFAVNRVTGGAMVRGGGGFERPSHCQFGPDGALYVADYGQLTLAPEKGGVRMVEGTGTLWRIRRTSTGLPGQQPTKPLDLPLNALRLTLPLVGGAVGIAALIFLVRRLAS